MSTEILRVLIVDDEAPARARARRLLLRIGDVEILAEAENGAQALVMIEEHAPDVVLLDIHMPELDGLRLLQALDDPPAVIFATAHESHAVQAFDLEATDYLLKPYSAERLARALNRVRQQFPAPVAMASQSAPVRIPAEDGAETLLLGPEEIDAAELEEGVVFLLRADGDRCCFAGNLQELEELLPGDSFLRISRQRIVNLEAIRSVASEDDGGLQLRLRSGAVQHASRRRARHLRARLRPA